MKSGPSRYVKHLLGAALAKLLDKEVAFRLGATFPIDEFVPFLDESFDILVFVILGLSRLDRIVPKMLLIGG
ncbi:hypothetical protein NG895_10505 [Aeoliella sp. ICT_H6.2]|uniref:Uncharacterized protein n=1 Tax=Aeoliella straminimaris TaxID=2954799 RepID=A0A9X2JGF8_9BACT|nr:hypothetical protein [Aeoliella straminimaris]